MRNLKYTVVDNSNPTDAFGLTLTDSAISIQMDISAPLNIVWEIEGHLDLALVLVTIVDSIANCNPQKDHLESRDHISMLMSTYHSLYYYEDTATRRSSASHIISTFTDETLERFVGDVKELVIKLAISAGISCNEACSDVKGISSIKVKLTPSKILPNEYISSRILPDFEYLSDYFEDYIAKYNEEKDARDAIVMLRRKTQSTLDAFIRNSNANDLMKLVNLMEEMK